MATEPENPYKALLAKWDAELAVNERWDSTHTMGATAAMKAMADELREVIDACEED